MVDLTGPFAECERMMCLRAKLAKLACTDLPILVSGEPGTGRRTLANQIASVRQERVGVLAHALQAGDSLGNPPLVSNRATPLAIEDLHCMSDSDQKRLASWLKNGVVILSATTTENPEASITPELAVVLSYPSSLIRIPPLRARGGDVVSWAELFLARIDERLALSSDARQAIRARDWTGNLLELRFAIERAAGLSEGRVITAQAVEASGPGGAIVPLSEAVAAFRRRYVLETLERFDGNRTKTARALGVDPRTVFRLIQESGEQT